MALITRISRLFRADVHDILDRIEEPQALLRQAIRDMEEELSRDAQRLEALGLERARLEERRADLEESLPKTDTELDLCFAAGEEELARALVQRKLEAERFAKHLARKVDSLQQAITALRRRVDENRARLDAMRQKAELASEQLAVRGDACADPRDWAVREEDVEVAFLREKQRRARS